MSSEYRKVSTKLSKNKRFRSVDATAKLVYYYLITNPATNSAGCYEIPTSDIAYELGLQDFVVDSAMIDLSKVGLVAHDQTNEVILIERALKHWPVTNFKHAHGAITRLVDLPDCQLRSRRMFELLQCDKLVEDQSKYLEKALDNSVNFDSPLIGLSPPRPRPDQDQDHIDPPKPPLKQGGRRSANKGSRWEEKSLPKDYRTYALEKYKEWNNEVVDLTYEAFQDHWLSVAGAKGVKRDWKRVWQTWCRNEYHKYQTFAKTMPAKSRASEIIKRMQSEK